MTDRRFIAYRIVSSVTGEAYIGITARPLRTRWAEHCYDARRNSARPLQTAIRQHGPAAFSVEEIAVYCSDAEMRAAEIALIEVHCTLTPMGFNATKGGDGHLGWIPSESTRALWSAKLKGLKRSPESCARIGASKRGSTHSAEARQRISVGGKGVHAGRVISDEWRAKLARAQTGKLASPETRAKMSASHTGKPHPRSAPSLAH